MDECGGLENRWSRKAPVGSNPTPSAVCWQFRAFRDRVRRAPRPVQPRVQPTARVETGRVGTNRDDRPRWAYVRMCS